VTKPSGQENKSEPNVISDVEEIFELWLRNQLKRYDKVKEVVEPFMKSKKMILPAEKTDFMIWFVNNAIKTNDYFSVKIEDNHFVEYHEERLKAMKKPIKWEGFHNELMNAGYIQPNLEVFNHVMEHQQLPAGGTEKIQWLTSKADALDVRTNFNFTMTQFDQCFRSANGKPFTWNVQVKYRSNRNKVLYKIIENYRPKPEL
jgi:hypothetical protein